MKKLLILICLLLNIASAYANKIDQLKTDSDVVRFIKTTSTDFTAKYAPPVFIHSAETIKNNAKCLPAAKDWDIKNWQKLDFNNDGLTDLAAIIYWGEYANYVVIDKGNNKFQLICLYQTPFEPCELISTSAYNGTNLVIFHQFDFIPDKASGLYTATRGMHTDTLIYKFDNFVELNLKPDDYKIDSIEFSTGQCLGTCPVFSMVINGSGMATYTAGMFLPKTGKFNTIVKKTDLKELFDLINYLNIKNLKGNYEVPWSDASLVAYG